MVKFHVCLGDITRIRADAIVNAANTTLLGGGGVDGAIHRAAGPELLEACRRLGGCATGEAKMTEGFLLPAKYVIHTVGPVWVDGQQGEDRLLRACYWNSLALANEHQLRHVVFPAISTGVYRFPLDRASQIAVTTCRDYARIRSAPSEITFCCYSAGAAAIYRQLVAGSVPES